MLVTRPVNVCRAVPVLNVPLFVNVLKVKVSFNVLFLLCLEFIDSLILSLNTRKQIHSNFPFALKRSLTTKIKQARTKTNTTIK